VADEPTYDVYRDDSPAWRAARSSN
jgi:hypothetical protein